MMPVIEGLIERGPAPRSRSTPRRRRWRRAALAAGATLVNDVTALRGDPAMAEVVAGAGADCCLMHMLGDPRTMQHDPHYDDVVGDIKAFLAERLALAVRRGIAEERILLDPGIGFGKTSRAQPGVAAPAGRVPRTRAPAGDRHLAQGVPRAG